MAAQYTKATANAEFWAQKIEKNMQRDRDTDARLKAVGWLPVRVWEHEDPIEAVRRIVDLVRERASRSAGHQVHSPS